MFMLTAPITLYLLVLVAMGGIWARNRRGRLSAAQGLPAAGNLISAATWLKSVNWNGGDDKKSGGK